MYETLVSFILTNRRYISGLDTSRKALAAWVTKIGIGDDPVGLPDSIQVKQIQTILDAMDGHVHVFRKGKVPFRVVKNFVKEHGDYSPQTLEICKWDIPVRQKAALITATHLEVI